MLTKIGIPLLSYRQFFGIPIIYQHWYLSCQILQLLYIEIPILVYLRVQC